MRGMRSLLLWLLLSSIIFQVSFIQELMKFPLLCIHYAEKHNNVSFLTFLQNHYERQDLSDESHQQFPFYSIKKADFHYFFQDFTPILVFIETKLWNVNYCYKSDPLFQLVSDEVKPPQYLLA